MFGTGASIRAMRLVVATGTRPNLPKVAALQRAAGRLSSCEVEVVHTRQHDDPAMYDALVRDLGMQAPRHCLETPAGVVGDAFVAAARGCFAAVLRRLRPDVAIVVGDVNSTLACALGAVDADVPLAHVEAGLRSFDLSMPEERNRIAIDRLARWHFTTEEAAHGNLAAEGLPANGVYLVGNTMVDSLLANLDAAQARQAWLRHGLARNDYLLVTLHRPGTVDDEERLFGIVEALTRLPMPLPILFPVHPRTLARLQRSPRSHAALSADRFHITPPLGYLEFLSLQCGARLVLTDSGGVQEETTALDVPCLTLRDSTERPVTIELGSNLLVGRDPDAILAAVAASLAAPKRRQKLPPQWDGRAADRILSILLAELGRSACFQATG
jgi:UDP-N-acetylglucosamine 2-epimerase (non-hydrolysing)